MPHGLGFVKACGKMIRPSGLSAVLGLMSETIYVFWE